MWGLYGKIEYESFGGSIVWRTMRLEFNTRSDAVKASRRMHNNNIGWIPKAIVFEGWRKHV